MQLVQLKIEVEQVKQILEHGRHKELTRNKFELHVKHTVEELHVKQLLIQGRQVEDAKSL